MHALRTRLQIAATLSLLALASCNSSGWYDHRFSPAPIETALSSDTVAGSQVRSLVTVIGIQQAQEGKPDRAVLRLRLENIGSVPATFVPEMASLLTADLVPFGPPEVAPGSTNEIASGANAQYDLAFPIPAGRRVRDLDLTGLNFRFAVGFDGKRVTTGMTFQRTDWSYYDSYPHVQVGVGFTSVH